MCSFLAQLNHRISGLDLSDGTIASVACLTIIEHIHGNDKLSEVHAEGLATMVRLRGGLHAISRMRRVEVARADIVRSVDNMVVPLLPRIAKAIPASVPRIPARPTGFDEMINDMSRTRICTDLIKASSTLGSICQSLEDALGGDSVLDTTDFYEAVLCLIHDLLSLDPRSPLDEVLRICLLNFTQPLLGILNFTQPLFRYCVFAGRSCRVRSAKLRLALDQIADTPINDDLRLWITFNGYVASFYTIHRSWYRPRLLALFGKRSIPTSGAWDRVKAHLRRFLWTDSIFETNIKQFYDTLEQDDPSTQGPCHACGSLHAFVSTLY